MASMAEDWILGRYIHLAVCRSSFVERKVLSEEFEATVARLGKVSAPVPAVLSTAEPTGACNL